MRLAVALGLAMLTAPQLMPQAAPQAEERQLEAAIHREVVAGDLKGAMNQYRAILAQAGAAKPVAARALFQMGQCLEKLGRRQEAYDAYWRLASEFPDQAETAAQARSKLLGWDEKLSAPANLAFEEGLVGRVPTGWFVPTLSKDADYMAELRRTDCHSGNGCAVVTVPGNAARPLSDLMQSFSAGAYRGKTVRLTAWLRLEAAGAEDHVQMWLRVNREKHGSGFFDNMEDRPLRASQWTRCEIVGKVAEDAAFIEIGIMSIGRGRAWVDDVSFEVVPAGAESR